MIVSMLTIGDDLFTTVFTALNGHGKIHWWALRYPKHNLKHFSRFFESVVKYGVSKQNLKHFSRFCSKFGDNPNKN